MVFVRFSGCKEQVLPHDYVPVSELNAAKHYVLEYGWPISFLCGNTIYYHGPCDNFCCLGHTKKSQWWWWSWWSAFKLTSAMLIVLGSRFSLLLLFRH